MALLFSAAPPMAKSVPAPSFALHSGDKVVFYGDSITDQRMYTMLTEFFVVTRYPQLTINFVHSGWGGDRVSGGGGGPINVRLERDVLAYHPTVMTILLGMNDGDYSNHTANSDTVYKDGYKHIIEVARKAEPGLRITLIGPSPFDDVTRPLTLQPDGYNAVMKRYSDWVNEYAREQKLGFVDFNKAVVAMLRKVNAEDPAAAQKIIPDRIHPTLAGHLIMAAQLLKAWSARPVVSSVAIDATAGKVTQSDFTKITDFHAGFPFVWTQTDEALPLPFANMVANDKDHLLGVAIRDSDVTDTLDRQPLRITGLPVGHYDLTCDGDLLGSYSAAELDKGINLATLDTPMSRQAMEVRDLVSKRLDVHQQEWRTYKVGLGDEELQHLAETVSGMERLEAELGTRERAAAQPVPHVFQVTQAQ